MITKHIVSLLCSACDTRSYATNSGSVLESTIIPSSVGPAIISMEVSSLTIALAILTNFPPGPTILSTFCIDFVPYANAAIACAPPTL